MTAEPPTSTEVMRRDTAASTYSFSESTLVPLQSGLAVCTRVLAEASEKVTDDVPAVEVALAAKARRQGLEDSCALQVPSGFAIRGGARRGTRCKGSQKQVAGRGGAGTRRAGGCKQVARKVGRSRGRAPDSCALQVPAGRKRTGKQHMCLVRLQ